MNEIYKKAIDEQGSKGSPIFSTNIRLNKLTKHGNSKTLKKESFVAKKVILSGTIEEMKKDKYTKIYALKELFGKEKAFSFDLEKCEITSIEIILFHGYSFAAKI